MIFDKISSMDLRLTCENLYRKTVEYLKGNVNIIEYGCCISPGWQFACDEKDGCHKFEFGYNPRMNYGLYKKMEILNNGILV